MKSKLKIIALGSLIIAIAIFYYFRNNSPKIKMGSAELSWNRSEGNDIAGYKIYYGKNSRNGDCPRGGYEKEIDVKDKINYKIGNLEPGKTYYFSITSYNNNGKESCFSEEMKKEIKLSKFQRWWKFLNR